MSPMVKQLRVMQLHRLNIHIHVSNGALALDLKLGAMEITLKSYK